MCLIYCVNPEINEINKGAKEDKRDNIAPPNCGLECNECFNIPLLLFPLLHIFVIHFLCGNNIFLALNNCFLFKFNVFVTTLNKNSAIINKL